MELNDKIDEAIAGALGDAYDCMRVWNAWSYGTMSADDFIEVREQTDRIAEIREAVMAVLRTQEPVGEVTTVFMKSGERDTYAINIDSRLNVGDKLYAAPVPPSAPPDQAAIEAIAHRTCTKYLHGERPEYTFLPHTLMDFVQRLALPAPAASAAADVDALAQFIRETDGNHQTGAGKLAERIVEWLAAAPKPEGE